MAFLIRTFVQNRKLNPDAHDDLAVCEVEARENVRPANLT